MPKKRQIKLVRPKMPVDVSLGRIYTQQKMRAKKCEHCKCKLIKGKCTRENPFGGKPNLDKGWCHQCFAALQEEAVREFQREFRRDYLSEIRIVGEVMARNQVESEWD